MNNVSIKEFKNAIDTMLNGYIDGVSYLLLLLGGKVAMMTAKSGK